ncbi:MAG: polysaccharide deacetylase family protein [Chthoniobacteraceae bacterium]
MLRRTLAALLIPLAAFAAEPESPAPQTPKPAEVEKAPVATTKITYNQCNVDGPFIAMTFDDGPHGTNTPRLLDMLKQRGIHATFFVCGECVAQYPEIARRIVDEGHEIANHSWSHPNLIPLSEAGVRSQLERTHQVVKQTTGAEIKVFRPPYGNFTQRQRAWAHGTYGYKTIIWDVDPLDWKVRNAAHVENEIVKRTVAGSIVLAHDIHKTTVDAMPSTFDALLAKGFKFVTVSELIAKDRPAAPKPKASTPAPEVKPTAKK